MSHSKYLIVGSSHAGLAALEAIRTYDGKGSITLITQEEHLPYSPTILPYVVSGEADPEKIFLMGEAALDQHNVTFKRGAKLVDVDPVSRCVRLESGDILEYGNLLLATGAEPALPPVPGLEGAPIHVLRTLDDAMGLRETVKVAKSVIVLGAGLIGMHAAESLAKGGLQVTIVETLPQVLPGYFNGQAADMIQKVFTEHGIKILTGTRVTQVAASKGGWSVSLESGDEVPADRLLVAAGVEPRIAYLAGTDIETNRGIQVNDTMKTNRDHIWAAGDVTRARSFSGSQSLVHATLTTAVEQGRTAGMDMSGDPALKPYGGDIPMNTYNFFNHRSFSIGPVNIPQSEEGIEVDQEYLPDSMQYQRMVYQNNRLVSVSGINRVLDPGIMYQLIKKRVDLGEVKKEFIASPLETGRVLMSKIWG